MIYKRKFYEERLKKLTLSKYIYELAGTLIAKGYSKHKISHRIYVVIVFCDWVNKNKIKLEQLDVVSVGNFLNYRLKQTDTQNGEKITLTYFLEILYMHGIVPKINFKKKSSFQFQKIKNDYNAHLFQERGTTIGTSIKYWRFIYKFLFMHFNNKTVDFEKIKGMWISNFVSDQAQVLSPCEASMLTSALRSFFRFLLSKGKIKTNLAGCVPSMPNWRNNNLPLFLTESELKHLLQFTRKNGKLPKRNYAILLLLSRLGLRTCEVVNLELDDIDWEQCTIQIKGKGRESLLPLPNDVAKAMIDYLKYERPTAKHTRRFFLCKLAPVRGMKSSATLSTIVMRAIKRAGLNPPKKGAYLLRHTLANHCLRQGVTLFEIGRILRHQNIDTTAIYAKADFSRLRELSFMWPNAAKQGGDR